MARPELEFFLLTIVQDHYYPIWYLDSPTLSQDVAQQSPEFTLEELQETLFEMCRAGDLRVRLRRHSGPDRRPFVPTIAEIDAALCGALQLEYGLTKQGGARWEAMSEFDWNYHLGDWGEDGFACISREMIETYLSWSHDGQHDPASRKWSIERPYRATYWKTLPQGVRVSFERNPGERRWTEYDVIGDLWSREWNERRGATMRKFVPMATSRTEPVADVVWRVRLAKVAERPLGELPHLLNAEESAVQYAAALQLVESDEFEPLLIDWFRERQTRYALRIAARIRGPHVFDALVEVFKGSKGENTNSFRCQLGEAVASYGDAAVARLARELEVDSCYHQWSVLDSLGKTRSEAAEQVLLEWLEPRVSTGGDSLLVERALLALNSLGQHAAVRDMLDRFLRSKAPLRHRWRAACEMARVRPEHQEIYQRFEVKRDAEHLRSSTEWIVFLGGGVKLEDPVATLVAMLKHTDPRHRTAVITLICQHNDRPFPIDAMAGMLHDPVPEVRANAVCAIGLRGGARELPIVEPLLNDASGLVRYCAREAQRRITK